MRAHTLAPVLWSLLLGLIASTPVNAQSLGTFRWQQLPYCNILTLSVTQNGAVYRLEGTDDQCGAATQASVLGTAFLNPNGTIGLGFTVVATPGGAPQHVDAAIDLQSLGGTWRDGAGRTGTLAFRTGPGTGGSPRPPGGGLGAQAVDPTQVQHRLANGCAAGEAVRTVNQDGSVVCQAVGDGAGTITGVTAGTGLIGGGTSGTVTIDVATGGIGSAQIADGAVGVADIDLDEVQQKVRSACGAGLFMVTVDAGGNVVCTPGAAGQDNTAIGLASLNPGTTGGFNTAAGAKALMSNTAGASNSAFGRDALRANLTGVANTALGDEALRSNAAGNGNVAVGRFALAGNTTASFNTAVGEFALGANVNGAANTAVGQDSLRFMAASNHSTAVGYRALRLSTAPSNTAVGSLALTANTIGEENTAVGREALSANSTGLGNTAMGFNALMASTTALDNTAVGAHALTASQTGHSNTAVGSFALSALTGGGANTALGAGALMLNTGSSNTAVGGFALSDNIGGQFGTAVGTQALQLNTTGSNNTAVGRRALGNNTAGSDNIAIGHEAGLSLANGSGNILIGNSGKAAETDVIRIGASQTQTFIAGITGATVDLNTGVPVLIDGSGMLGTVLSSRRFKRDVQDMGDATRALHRLRPVTFRYIGQGHAGSTRPEYGLIAEEVAEVYPDLVVTDRSGDIQTVQYQKLVPMLLNEVQRLARERAALEDRLDGQHQEIAELRARLTTLAGAPRR